MSSCSHCHKITDDNPVIQTIHIYYCPIFYGSTALPSRLGFALISVSFTNLSSLTLLSSSNLSSLFCNHLAV